MAALLVTGLGSAAGVQARISWHPRRSANGRKWSFDGHYAARACPEVGTSNQPLPHSNPVRDEMATAQLSYGSRIRGPSSSG